MTPTPWEWLEAFLKCAAEELNDREDAEIKGAPPRQYVSTEGDPVWDDCCEHGGQLWTRILNAQPVNPLPDPDRSFTKCHGTMGVQIGVGIIRCGHTLTDDMRPPTASQLTSDARQIAEDMVTLYRAIVCCNDGRKILGQWTPSSGSLNIGGGCVGGEWDVWVPARFEPTTETSP